MAIGSIELGGTNIHAAMGEADGTILAERVIPTGAHFGPDAVLSHIAALIRDVGTPQPRVPHYQSAPAGRLRHT